MIIILKLGASLRDCARVRSHERIGLLFIPRVLEKILDAFLAYSLAVTVYGIGPIQEGFLTVVLTVVLYHTIVAHCSLHSFNSFKLLSIGY